MFDLKYHNVHASSSTQIPFLGIRWKDIVHVWDVNTNQHQPSKHLVLPFLWWCWTFHLHKECGQDFEETLDFFRGHARNLFF